MLAKSSVLETELSIAGVSTGREVNSANIWQLCLPESSSERFILTRNCSRRLSDSGVNSADIGMTSPARIMMALWKRSRQNKTVYFSCSCWLQGTRRWGTQRRRLHVSCVSSHGFTHFVYMRTCLSPAVPSVTNIELPEQIDDHQSCAASWDVVDCLLSFYLHILNTNTHIHTSLSSDNST